ncbi:MAG TPA: SRPBCC family protein [Candidatus Thermoplasmatota archaeon]
MERIEDSIECNVPLKTCYNQWTQFESFPEFMEGVKMVRQIDDRRCQWTAEIGGKEKSWEAEIYRQLPDKEIAWRATSGAKNQGRVTFESRGATSTLVRLNLEYEPEGAVENIGEALGLIKKRVVGDLRRFKEFLEARKYETGAWRGEIRGGEEEEGASGTVSATAQTTTGGDTAATPGGLPGSGPTRRRQDRAI